MEFNEKLLGKGNKKRCKINKKSLKNCIFFPIDDSMGLDMFLNSFLVDFERDKGEGESVFFEVFRAWPFGLFRRAAQDPQGSLSGRLGLSFWVS